MIEPGEPAPAFRLPDRDGNPVSLEDFAGQTVVLHFYATADTTGLLKATRHGATRLPGWTPSQRPATRSAIAPRAVSSRTGVPMPPRRMRLQVSNPSTPAA